MRFTPLLILVAALALSACGKKDLEADTEATPASTPAPAEPAPPPTLPGPGVAHPFRVPDATTKLPSTIDTLPTATTPTPGAGSVDDTATVTVRPAEAPPANGGSE